ncbi:MAG TPA: TauD/TfdA family dioxygenase [Methylomirabilota bacterium]|nr:TauD/TfdA family dioxygenase [Methylomirabilota bacterium]
MLEYATQPQFVYRHSWRVTDLVMWDNRCVLHRGRPWDESKYRRVMHRTTVAGEGPTAIDGRPLQAQQRKENDDGPDRSAHG